MGIGKKFVKYVSQNIFGMLGISCYVVADTFFISKYAGADGITVLNLVLPVFSVIFAFGSMMGVGSAIRFKILRARGDAHADDYFSNSIMCACILSILFILVGIFAPDKLLHIMGADDKITAIGIGYTRTFLMFTPFFMCNYIVSAYVRNDNDPSRAMLATLSGSLFNIVFDYIFMFPMKLGLAGAALATAISPAITMAICTTHYLGKKNHVGFRWVRPSIRHLVSCCQLGISAFVGELSSAIITIIFNMLLLGIAGNVSVAAYGVVANLSLVAMSIFNGLAQGAQPLISKSYGEGQRDHVKSLLRWSLIASAVLEAVTILVVWGFTDNLIAVFNSENNQQLLDYAHVGLRIYFLGFLFAGINIMLVAYFSAVDRAVPAITGSLMRGVIAIAISAVILSRLFGINGVWSSFLSSEIITFVVLLVLAKAGKKRGLKNEI